MPAIRELIMDIENYSGAIDSLKTDQNFKQKVNNMMKILDIKISL